MERQDISGIELSRTFYTDVVEPLIHWPDLKYSAALIGHGSEVLGFDDAVSRDHHWGPRVQLFLEPSDRESLSEEIREYLANNLPYTILGYPTNFSSPDPNDNGVRLLKEISEGPVDHMVEILDLESYLHSYIGVRTPDAIDEYDWLTIPEQKLRSLVSGEVFHDGLETAEGNGALGHLREVLSYYPRDVWYYQMAAAWARIGQEEHLTGRAGMVGDEVGSAIIAARIVRDIMRLGFLMERTYAPYPKWFGSAFKNLSCASELYPILMRVLHGTTWRERDAALSEAYHLIAVMHNRLGITDVLPDTPRSFHGRPFTVIAFHGFSEAILARISDGFLTGVMKRSPVGGIDQISDNTDVLEDVAFRPGIRSFFAGV